VLGEEAEEEVEEEAEEEAEAEAEEDDGTLVLFTYGTFRESMLIASERSADFRLCDRRLDFFERTEVGFWSHEKRFDCICRILLVCS
jgi:hypothetical protein